ncbi:hypothetical protein [Lentzea sp. CA-135723]|uniref:hypothetical protein n=1 Tax=Lentzea sp. CA-135723 TaxID=3239950 RepID=UPI003D938482
MVLENPIRHATRSGAMVAVAAIVASMFAAPAAHAADPSTKFRLDYGASYAVGTLRWHARSVDVDFSIKAGYCRELRPFAFDNSGREHRPPWWPGACNKVYSDTVNVPVDVVGGAFRVRLDLTDEKGKLLVSRPCVKTADCVD